MASADSRSADRGSAASRGGDLRWDIIELLFFAYRDFVGDADANRDQTRAYYLAARQDGFKQIAYIEVRKMGHQPPPPAWFDRAIEALDDPKAREELAANEKPKPKPAATAASATEPADVSPAAKELRLALVESGQGRIGSKVDELLLYCFHYDPAVGQYGWAVMTLVRVGGVLTVALIAGFVLVMRRREGRAPVERHA